MVLHADTVDLGTENEVAVAFFADTRGEEPRYLALQRALDLEDSLHYVEVNDQSCSGYAGVETFTLGRGEARVAFQGPLAQARTEDGEPVHPLTVRFRLEPGRFEALRTLLRRIFEGHAGYAEVAGPAPDEG